MDRRRLGQPHRPGNIDLPILGQRVFGTVTHDVHASREVDYRLAQGFSVGGTLQLGLDDDHTIVSPTGHLRYTFDLSGGGSDVARVRPFIQGGLGFTFIDLDNTPPGVDDDETGFMLNFGFGTELVLTDTISVGSKMLFNFMPDDVMNENFYYSWEIATVRYRF